jgi:hypothetical protein
VSYEPIVKITAEVRSLTERVEAMVERCVVLDDELWYWAQYRAKQLGKESVSQYLFDLIIEDRQEASKS